MSNFLALAEETFFMAFPHVRKHFIIAKEAFSTELAKWVYSALNLVFLLAARLDMPIVS